MTHRILVVEDHPETRDGITIILELAGYEVIVANNGQEGIEKACSERPDLIITDLRMPQLDGLEMIKQLRARSDCEQVPILVTTAFHMRHTTDAIEAGANRALAKPIEPDLLCAFVKELLMKKRTR